ncbi:MAG: hypothetical protein ACM3PP_00260 [Candidatus Saccharibacteria bacterium]
MARKMAALFICIMFLVGLNATLINPASAVQDTVPGDGIIDTGGPTLNADGTISYAPMEDKIISGWRLAFNGSLAHRIAARAIWYLEYGFTVYGHTQYATTGFIDCSQYTSRIYKDFGYPITGVSRYYDTVGTVIQGVYSTLQPGSTTKWMLVGTENLKPGDILTWWKDDPTLGRHIGHVGIYLGKIYGYPSVAMTISGRPTALGILTSFTYWYGEHFQDARRILPASAYVADSNYKGITAGTAYEPPAPVIPALYQMQPTYPVIQPKDLPNGF